MDLEIVLRDTTLEAARMQFSILRKNCLLSTACSKIARVNYRRFR